MFKLFLLFCALVAIPMSDAVQCFSCTGVESEKQCRNSIDCGSDVVSCKKELYYKNGKHLISKGCHSIDYEKNDECINSRFTDGPNKGDFERCLCTGDKLICTVFEHDQIFFAIYAIGLVLVFHNLSQVDGIKCKTCTKASKLEDCNEELTCPANIASCLKFTHFLDGKMKINKGCGIVEFEEGDYCMESKITAGSQKGPKTVLCGLECYTFDESVTFMRESIKKIWKMCGSKYANANDL
ncbi:unnamed protein product [Lepeophtheirus salmonis]|uniref:(salmon louse) hypothetical protein n=1 Tax=Lepeophtheirus salmonis TaxID=72036 RepID=A0A7R8GZS9_LEPSM|nr:unnamed protein product [Lepeophtheirus salmonis]CAF2757814.1 unnamed protein product [Lepeophtheirus salmonis]